MFVVMYNNIIQVCLRLHFGESLVMYNVYMLYSGNNCARAAPKLYYTEIIRPGFAYKLLNQRGGKIAARRCIVLPIIENKCTSVYKYRYIHIAK